MSERTELIEHLQGMGWIPARSEYFRHIAPPAMEAWLGASDAAASAGGGWTIEPLDQQAQGLVEIYRLAASESGEQALFAGTRTPAATHADRFGWAHRASWQQGLRLKIGHDGSDQPVRLTLHHTPQAAVEAPTLVLDLAEGANCVLVETHERFDQPLVQNMQLHVLMAQGSRLRHVRTVTPAEQDQIAHNIHVNIGQRADYRQALIGNGSAYHLQRTELYLDGDDGEGDVGAALFVTGSKLDLQAEAFHTGHRARSDVEGLMLASGRAHGVMNAMCRIAHGADGSWVRQHISGIPTGGQPRLVLRPHMEICHDNVEAIHGATWGSLPEDAMFYARQRGLSENMARALIVEGMMKALLAHTLDDAELLERLDVMAQLSRAVAAHLDTATARG